MNFSSPLTRREICRKALLFSAALALPRTLLGQTAAAPHTHGQHFLCLGDWGTGNETQFAVARALQRYTGELGRPPDALLLLGDNFYGRLEGVDSPRWKQQFEDMYPAADFPGACYAVLGNHDYDDQPGGQDIQLAYAKTGGTRWRMPSLWYRVDLPLVSFLCVNTHYAKLKPEEIAAQEAWLKSGLAASRTKPWLIVCGHHPVLSCGKNHRDSKHLAHWRDLFQEHHVDAYLCGHEHDLQHLKEEGRITHWVVSGGGGQGLHPVEPDDRAHFGEATHGFFHLALSEKELTGRFVNADGKVIHEWNQQRNT